MAVVDQRLALRVPLARGINTGIGIQRNTTNRAQDRGNTRSES
jgi:hypothetical protein